VKDKDLQSQPIYDWYQRYSFIDHFLGEGTTPEAFSMSCYPEIGNFVNKPYVLKRIEKEASKQTFTFLLKREGFVLQDDRQIPISIEKNFTVKDAAMEIDSQYSVTNKSDLNLNLWFGIEFNFTLLAGEDPLRYYQFPDNKIKMLFMNAKGDFLNIPAFEMNDEWSGFGMKFYMNPEADVWVFPIETVSQSEVGLEKTYQGSTFLIHWQTPLERKNEQKRSIKLAIYKINDTKHKN
jgi:alpha-amylase